MKETIEMFTIKCNNCGKLFEDEYEGYCAWVDAEGAWEEAQEYSWIREAQDVHYCPACYSYDSDDNLIIKSTNQ